MIAHNLSLSLSLYLSLPKNLNFATDDPTVYTPKISQNFEFENFKKSQNFFLLFFHLPSRERERERKNLKK
jgi:hypothetical protein